MNATFMSTSLLKDRNLPVLLTGMLLTAVVSLSVHAVMLQGLDIPFPSVAIDAPVASFVSGSFLNVLALIYLAQLAAPTLEKHTWIGRTGILFVVWMGLNEALFRGAFMEGYCTEAFTYAFVTKFMKLLPSLVVAALVASMSTRLVHFWQKAAAALVLGAFWKFALAPAVAIAFKAPLAALAFLAPQSEWCQLPYGANVLIPAYLSFIEPTLACAAAVALVSARLSRTPMIRLLQFILLVLLLKKMLLAPFIYMIYANLPPLTALGSMGQFTLEALCLALGSGLTWSIAGRGKITPGVSAG